MTGSTDTPQDEEAVRAALRDIYTEEGVEIWLRGRKRLLGGERPIDLIERGEIDRVLAVVEMLASGAAS